MPRLELEYGWAGSTIGNPTIRAKHHLHARFKFVDTKTRKKLTKVTKYYNYRCKGAYARWRLCKCDLMKVTRARKCYEKWIFHSF
jgi:hypothetical protein